MKKKIRLKHRKKSHLSKKKILLLGVVFVFIITGFLINYIGKTLNPTLLNYAEIETKRLSVTIINDAVTNEVTEILDKGDLFDITQNNDGEIQTVDFNSQIVNQVLQLATNAVQEKLTALEEGDVDKFSVPNTLRSTTFSKLKEGIVCEIPLGVLSNNSLLSNIGPKFPVRLSFIGAVLGNVNTKINNYGINNAIVEISVHIEITQRIIMPLVSKEVLISTDIPIAIKMVQGKVPIYYQNGLDENSNLFSLPIK